MELQKPKIALYVKRPFGEKLNASFDFIKENRKPLFKYLTYLILPLCLIQAVVISRVMGSMTAPQLSGGADENQLFSSALDSMGTSLLYCLGFWLVGALIYTMMQLYDEREERLEGIVFSDIKPLLLDNVKRSFALMFVSGLLCGIVAVLVIFLAVLTPFTLILTLPLFLAFMMPLFLAFPIYLFEDISLNEALAKAFRLGFATWGGLFLIALVMGIIGGVLQVITCMPWYITIFVRTVFAMSDGGATSSSIGLNFVQYLSSVLMLFGFYISYVFTTIGFAYQYGHASEVMDSVTVESDIDNFDKL